MRPRQEARPQGHRGLQRDCPDLETRVFHTWAPSGSQTAPAITGSEMKAPGCSGGPGGALLCRVTALAIRLTSWLSLGSRPALTLCQLIFVCRAESSQLLQQPWVLALACSTQSPPHTPL